MNSCNSPLAASSSGAEVVDIEPAEDKLAVETRVQPLDIDVARIGL